MTEREQRIMAATLDLMDAMGPIIERHFRSGDGYDGTAVSAVVSSFAALQVAIERAHVRDLCLANEAEACEEKLSTFLAAFHASFKTADEHLARGQRQQTRAETEAARKMAIRVAGGTKREGLA